MGKGTRFIYKFLYAKNAIWASGENKSRINVCKAVLCHKK